MARRWIGRAFAFFYVATVTAAVVLLIVIGESLLAGWLAALETASVVTIAVLTRSDRRRGEDRPVPDVPPGPRTRLGTPLDPGMPSGRR